jgi:hypothetical protein
LSDPWAPGVLKGIYPQLFLFARKKSCSILQFLTWEDSRSFFLPLSHISSDQLAALKADIQGLNLDLVSNDIWSYSWVPILFLLTRLISVFKVHTQPPLFSNGNGSHRLKINTNFSSGFSSGID